MLFCTTNFQFVLPKHCVFRKISSDRTAYTQNCVSPDSTSIFSAKFGVFYKAYRQTCLSMNHPQTITHPRTEITEPFNFKNLLDFTSFFKDPVRLGN